MAGLLLSVSKGLGCKPSVQALRGHDLWPSPFINAWSIYDLYDQHRFSRLFIIFDIPFTHFVQYLDQDLSLIDSWTSISIWRVCFCRCQRDLVVSLRSRLYAATIYDLHLSSMLGRYMIFMTSIDSVDYLLFLIYPFTHFAQYLDQESSLIDSWTSISIWRVCFCRCQRDLVVSLRSRLYAATIYDLHLSLMLGRYMIFMTSIGLVDYLLFLIYLLHILFNI